MDPELEKEEDRPDDTKGDIDRTKRGLKRIRVGLIASLIALIIGSLTTLYLNYMFRTGDLAIFGKFMIISAISGIVQSGILIVYLVFLFIGVRSLIKGSGAFSKTHRKNIEWAWKLLIGIVILYVVNFLVPFMTGFLADLFGSMSGSVIQMALMVGFVKIIGTVILICWILLMILCIKEIAHKRSRDMIYLFGIVSIVNYTLMTLVNALAYSLNLSSDLLYLISDIMFYLSMVLSLAIVVLAILAYRGAEKKLRLKGEPDVIEGGFLGRPAAVSRYTAIGLSNPIRPILIFLVAGAIMGGVNGYQFYSMINDPFDSVDGGDLQNYIDLPEGPMVEMEDVLTEHRFFSDTVMEGESMEFDINDLGPIIFVTAKLSWTDEADVRMKENEPDHFELGIVMNLDEFEGAHQIETGENPHGGEGQIVCEIPYGEGSAQNYINATVIVTLIEAGDIHRATGPELIYYTDDSNSFTLDIEIGYITMEDYMERLRDM